MECPDHKVNLREDHTKFGSRWQCPVYGCDYATWSEFLAPSKRAVRTVRAAIYHRQIRFIKLDEGDEREELYVALANADLGWDCETLACFISHVDQNNYDRVADELAKLEWVMDDEKWKNWKETQEQMRAMTERRVLFNISFQSEIDESLASMRNEILQGMTKAPKPAAFPVVDLRQKRSFELE